MTALMKVHHSFTLASRHQLVAASEMCLVYQSASSYWKYYSLYISRRIDSVNSFHYVKIYTKCRYGLIAITSLSHGIFVL